MNDKRLLVVDDDDAIRALLFTVLRRRGFKVDTARNGAEALERCAQCSYAVMLLDLMMPRLSGFEVLKAMQQLPKTGRPVIIVLTAGSEPTNLDSTLVAGAMRKPFDVELLVDMVSGCMSAAGDRPQTGACPPADSDQSFSSDRNEKTN